MGGKDAYLCISAQTISNKPKFISENEKKKVCEIFALLLKYLNRLPIAKDFME